MTLCTRQPLRLLIVAGSLGGGGAERRLIDLLKNLDRTKISPRLFLAYESGELLSEVPADVPIHAFDDGDRQQRFAQQLLAKLRCPCAARALYLREILAQHPTDAVMSWSLMCGYETALAILGKSVAHIAHVYCQPQADLNEVFPRRFPFRYRIGRWTYCSAAKVLANSEDLKAAVAQFYRLPPQKMETLLNVRDFQRIDRLAEQEPPIWQTPGPKVIAIGRLHTDKGYDILLQAIARLRTRLPQIHLCVVGQGPEESALREQASRLGLAEQVQFLGFQSNPYVFLRSADVFVMSSRREGMPGVLIEALACRVPVVATNCPTGPREILQDGKLGTLVPVDDPDALAVGLYDLLANPPSASQRELTRQSVIDKYDVKSGVAQLEQILNQLVMHHRNLQDRE